MGKIIPKSMLLVALYELNRAANGLSIEHDVVVEGAIGKVLKILSGMDYKEWYLLPGDWSQAIAAACCVEIIRQCPETEIFMNKKFGGDFRELFKEAAKYAGNGTLILREPA